MNKIIEDINDVDFSAFGRHLTVPFGRDPEIDTGYSHCWGAEYTLPLGEMRFGVENVEYRDSFVIPAMEQHRETQEVVIPGNTDFVIALALPRDINNHEEYPEYSDVRLFAIHPGDILVLNEHVWHTGCFPISGKEGHYFFMYKVRDELLYWRDIQNGELKVRL